jgi:Protein of unknown function (DUF550)
VSEPGAFDFAKHLHRQMQFSEVTFGPGERLDGILDHMAKEMTEVREASDPLSEWIDLVILALDGAWRSGASVDEIIAALVDKQGRNERRVWPDWRLAEAGKAIEHDRTGESTVESAHRIELILESGGYVDAGFVCTAPVGGQCRLHCPQGCAEFELDGSHEHPLVDSGECTLVTFLDNDGDWGETYCGASKAAVHSGPIRIWYDEGVGARWEYA